MKGNLAFKVYNYITAIYVILTLIMYNIGVWPFTENLVNKSYLPSGAAPKYLTVSALLLAQVFVFMFVLYILVNQHKKINVLFTNV